MDMGDIHTSHNRLAGRRRAPVRRLRARRALLAGLVLGLGGCLATTQEEVRLGAQYAAEINRQLPLVTDPEAVRYLTVLGDSLARVADQRNLDWHFFIVDQMEINAFAVPGGYIYINRGLIERSETLSELAGVIGHEIGHVTERHSMEQMAKAQQANVGLTIGCILAPAVCNSGVGAAAVQIGAGGLFAKFSRDDEREADRVAIQFVVRAGIDPRGIPAMFRTLLAERRRRPDALEGMFGTHPLAEDRVAETEAMIAQIDPVILASLTRDTPAFQRFKARVRALPPSPSGTP
jgi:predicted Zn-dependent protease